MAGRTSHKRKSTYAESVRNPLYREGEERVLRWLLEQGKTVTDDRDKHTWHDFTIDHAWPLDVKVDQIAHRSGRVGWELGIDHGESRLPGEGWGMHHGLAYVVYVLLPPEDKREGPWPFLLCHAGRLREFALANRDTPVAKGYMTNNPDGDRNGFGYALDITALRGAGVVLQEGVV